MLLRTRLAALILAVPFVSAAAPAGAAHFHPAVRAGIIQIGWDHPRSHRSLSVRQIRRILRDEGFRHIEFLETEGRVYTAHAEDYRDRRVIVRVSARSGEVLSVKVISRKRPRDHDWDDDRPKCWLPEGCSY